jgi:DNA invertase Pin-like site-specific DNA recombinase
MNRTVERLAENGVSLRSLTENVVTSTPPGRMVLHLFALKAEFERDLIMERVQAAKEAAARRGLAFGRPRKFRDDNTAEIATLMRSRSIRGASTSWR